MSAIPMPITKARRAKASRTTHRNALAKKAAEKLIPLKVTQ